MKRLRPAILFFSLLLLASVCGFAQPIYNMSNLTVDDCKGILLDSENGDPAGSYDHNENYTFSICIPGVPEITLVFESFCTEEPFNGMYFDYMRFYDGPDTLSAQIGGIYSGIDNPPPITATSGCLTVNFISDANVTCTGWRARWEIEVPPPIPPNILPITDVECDENTLRVTFDRAVPCSAITPAAFTINGSLDVAVTSATPVNCQNGTTRNVDLVVAPPFGVSGDYTVVFTMEETDICEEVHILTASQTFRVVNCPLYVSLVLADDPICAGSCTFLTARPSGGAVGTYSYSWNPPAPSARRIEICPQFPITYSVTVTDQQGGTAEASIAINPLPQPTIDGGDRSLCQSDDPFFLTASIPGGVWSANGITATATENGWYDPGLVNTTPDSVRYSDTNGCEALAIFMVNPLDEGTDDAACPGSPPFSVSGGLPVGGTWSGDNISTDGIFTPPAIPGSFVVTYSHPNGCQGSKTITVGAIQLPMLDTLCQSDTVFQIPIQPFGGIWSGPGIIDEDLGEFDPSEAEPGDNILHYAINGCEDSMSIFIKAIDAQWDFSACPDEAPFVLPGNWGPPGGIWTGVGILDTQSGLYDPAILGDGFNDTLQYSYDGCIDDRIAFIRYTTLSVNNTLKFCTDEADFELTNESVGLVPRDGDWNGSGIIAIDGLWFFRPSLAGPGSHTLIYEANTCIDSMRVEVFQAPRISPVTFCERDAPQPLQASLPDGLWSGEGITDEQLGIFSPAIAGSGSHTVFYDSPDGCTARQEIVVTPFENATIIGLEASYCFRDTLIVLQTSPPGGSLSIDGVPASQFNPALIGLGEHTVRYTVGSGACMDEVERVVQIGQPLSIILPFVEDSICYGFNIPLSVEGTGGEAQNGYTFFWNQGLGFGRHHIVNPTSTTTYTVRMEDGCSQPVTASLTVIVHPEIVVAYSTGPKVCHADSTTATIYLPTEAEHSFIWDSSPPFVGNSIVSRPTTYNVSISNLMTGCEVVESIELPGFPPITANFGLSPNGSCLSTLDPVIDVLDFSVGGVKGWWNFGDSIGRQRYVLGEKIQYEYSDPGEYLIGLELENQGGCKDYHEEKLCILPEYRLFAPNAISPNYDGLNDFFQFKGEGIASVEWQVFNRYGQIIFTGSGMEDRWDGVYKGLRVRAGVYTYVARYQTIYDHTEQVLNGFITVVY